VMSMADVITVNETEAAGIALPGDDSKVIVIKKGQSGGEIHHKGEHFAYQAREVNAVDTTGAGDSFAAGLMFGIASGMDLRSAVSVAAESAAITVTMKGPHGFWR